jgi:hypothetical protein
VPAYLHSRALKVIREHKVPLYSGEIGNPFIILTLVFRNPRKTSILKIRNMKNAVFWDVAPCGITINRRFGGTRRLHLQGRRYTALMISASELQSVLSYCLTLLLSCGIFFYPEDVRDPFIRNVGLY